MVRKGQSHACGIPCSGSQTNVAHRQTATTKQRHWSEGAGRADSDARDSSCNRGASPSLFPCRALARIICEMHVQRVMCVWFQKIPRLLEGCDSRVSELRLWFKNSSKQKKSTRHREREARLGRRKRTRTKILPGVSNQLYLATDVLITYL